jgi:hypothetical protein
MRIVPFALAVMVAGSADALTTQNLTCEMPGVGQAALITGFEGHYQLFEWWDKPADSLGMQVVALADCEKGQVLRASTLEQSDALMAAWDILWTAGRAGQAGDFAGLTGALTAAGFTVDALPLATGHCACTDEMIGLSGQ